jgi:ATP-dependent helicase HrpB
MLPINSILESVKTAINVESTVVISAPPGSGKTTVVPFVLMKELFLQDKKILVLEPRRLAAKNSALRVCISNGIQVGEEIGYRVRFDSKISKSTKVEYITEGIFINKILNDPELSDTGLVIFDEFHERNMDSDLSLALLEESRKLFRPDLKIIIMSATLNIDELKNVYPKANYIFSDGKSFDVEVKYLDSKSDKNSEIIYKIISNLDKEDGDILVFLPGVYEINKLYNLLLSKNIPNSSLFTLYGDMNYEDQKKVFLPLKDSRKIVLSTNIAETSITIDNISVVIDSGLRKKVVYDIGSGMNRLVIDQIALDSADQRKGRAGRTRDGVCYRLWTKQDENSFSKTTQPEILNSDLSNLLLTVKKFGCNTNEMFWINPPGINSISKAEDLLYSLGAIDSKKYITPLGNKMTDFPFPVRLAAMVLKSNQYENYSDAINLAIILSEKIHNKTDFINSGISPILDYLKNPSFKNSIYYDKYTYLYKDIHKRLNQIPRSGSISIGGILALGYPDRIGKNRELGKEKFKLSSGKGAYLSKDDSLCESTFIVSPELDGDLQNSKIYRAAPISKNELLYLLKDLVVQNQIISTDSGDKIKVFNQTMILELLIEEKEITTPNEIKFIETLNTYLSTTECKDLNWNNQVLDYINRVKFLSNLNEKIPTLDIDHLKKSPKEWLQDYLYNINRISQLYSLDLFYIIKSFMSYSYQLEIEKEAPEFFVSPAGNKIKIRYYEREAIIEIKLQELFGMIHSPRIGYDKVQVTFHLLSPGRQPIQITKDLESFWKNTYPEVKKELRGRYPKHPWPENPYLAKPTSKTTRASLKEDNRNSF